MRKWIPCVYSSPAKRCQ